MGRHAGGRRLPVPVDPQRRTVDIHRIIEGARLSEARPALQCRERNDQRQREGGKNASRKHDTDCDRRKRSASATAQKERAQEEYERQGKHGGFRQIPEPEQRAKRRKGKPTALPSPDTQQQCRCKKNQCSNAEVRRYPRWAQPKVTGPEKKDVSPDPHGSRRNRRRFLG